MKRILNQKHFPFLVLVVFLGKSFYAPLSILDLSIIGMFSGLFFSRFYFEHKENLDQNEKVNKRIKELEDQYVKVAEKLEDRYDQKTEELLKVIETLEEDYNKRVKVFEGRISGIDVFYNKQKHNEQMKKDIGWG